jgi:5'-nucleotidase/UDP-sugar diphosphatase
MIIGGHSHTRLDAPAKENGVLIAQAGVGTDQIGRFDIVVDDDTNSIVDCNWQLVAIEPGVAEPDQKLMDYIDSYKQVVDAKYNSLLTKFNRTLTHPKREVETELGNVLADRMALAVSSDVVFLGSGSIRVRARRDARQPHLVFSLRRLDGALHDHGRAARADVRARHAQREPRR